MEVIERDVATGADHRRVVDSLDAAMAQLPLLDAGPGDGSLPLDGVPIPDKPRSRPKAEGKAGQPSKTAAGLRVYDPVPNARFGRCPGGSYEFIEDVKRAITFLNYWADNQFWAAIDLETSCGWREIIHEDGSRERTHWTTKKDPDPISSDPWTSTVFLCQVSVRPGYAYVFDMRPFMRDERFVRAFRRFLVRCKLVAHDSLFEQSFFMVQCFDEGSLAEYELGQAANIQFDTAIAHRVLTAGFDPANGLDDVTWKYEGVRLDKVWQKQFLYTDPASPLPDAAIQYAAGDVCTLLSVAQKIERDLRAVKDTEFPAGHPRHFPLWRIWEEMEQPLMYWMAKARVRGVLVDQSVLLKFREKIRAEVQAATAECERLIRHRVKHTVSLPGDITEERIAELGKAIQAAVRAGGGKAKIAEAIALSCQVQVSVLRKKNARKHEVEVEEPVNIGSPKQLIEWFKAHGGHWLGTSADETAMSSVIARAPNAKAVEAAKAVLRYRKAEKAEGTYVTPFLQTHLNPLTGRIHSFWKQCPTETGRMSSADPNLQNIPSRDEELSKLRNAFVAEPGHLLVTCDYSQFEVRVLAEMAGERAMQEVYIQRAAVNAELRRYCGAHGLDFFSMEGLEEASKDRWAQVIEQHPEVLRLVKQLLDLDFHRRTAATLFHGGDVSKVTKADRKGAKAVTFAVPYGSGAPGISTSAGIPVEDAQKLLDAYMDRFRMVKMWLDRQKLCVKTRGYTETPAGRRRYYKVESIPEKIAQLKPLEDGARQEAAEQEEEHRTLIAKAKLEGTPLPEKPAPGPKQVAWTGLRKKWQRRQDRFLPDLQTIAKRMYDYDLASAQRQACNAPIQGANADATKVATLIAAPRLRWLHPDCQIVMWVHDEIVVTCPAEHAKAAAEILEASMIEAACLYLKRVPVEVSCAIDHCWTK